MTFSPFSGVVHWGTIVSLKAGPDSELLVHLDNLFIPLAALRGCPHKDERYL